MADPDVIIEFVGIARSSAAEAAARRRMRLLQAGRPPVIEWHVRLQSLGLAGSQLARIQATACARTPDGLVLGEAMERDALAAMRAAFDALEPELDALGNAARARALAWLRMVKRRVASSA